jgi:hypothetical protein
MGDGYWITILDGVFRPALASRVVVWAGWARVPEDVICMEVIHPGQG